MDWKKLTDDVVLAAENAFRSLMEEHQEEHFYSFVLYTDGDAYTILAAANTIEQYRQVMIKYGETSGKEVPWCKWATAEWGYENWRGELFTGVYRDLQNFRDSREKSSFDYATYKKTVLECMIAALRRLDESGFFGEIRSSIVLFVSSTDNDETEEIENYSAKVLNSESVYQSFLKRYEV